MTDKIWRLRTVILLSPIMILVGFLLAYIALFNSVLHTKTGLVEASTGAFGLTLIFMGIVFPVVRLWQERSRRR